MSDYRARNCTTEEVERLRAKLHGYCMEGSFCRQSPPDYLFCQCQRGYTGELCDIPDFFSTGSLQIVLLAMICVAVVVVVGVVAGICLFRWRRRRQDDKERRRREQSDNPLVNRKGNQPLYPPAPPAGNTEYFA